MPSRKIRIKFFSSFIVLLIITSVFLSACSSVDRVSDTLSLTTETQESQLDKETEIFDSDSAFIIIEEFIIALLLIASIVGIITQRLRVPYTVGLVLIGLALAVWRQVDITLTPEVILALLVPPLVFEAAFHLNLRDLRYDIAPILALAIPGVLITTGLVGLVVHLGTGADLVLTLLFGALVAATDPVAVVALFRSIGVPKRLQVLLEGESLFNDGTAIVVFTLMLTVAIEGSFNLLNSIFDFVIISGGGLLVGAIAGMVFSQILNRIDDPLIETTLTGVLAFGSYLVAEQMHVSGVLAVVAAGLVAGNVGPRSMSPSSRVLVFNFWEIAAFIANSLVFLLIGLQIDLVNLIKNWDVIAVAILAVLAARAVSVYGLSWIGRNIPRKFKHVLYWGGLRGAISLALAISLPSSLGAEIREDIRAMAFGVVLFTLLVQGLTMQPLIKKMGLIKHSEIQEEYQRRHARAQLSKAAYDQLEKMQNNGLISQHVWESLAPAMQEHTEITSRSVRNIINQDLDIETDEFSTARRETFLIQRSTLASLFHNGIINEDVFSQLATEVDQALTDNEFSWPSRDFRSGQSNISTMMTAVIQEQDVENTMAALERLGVPMLALPSAGEFLGRRNSTILIGIPDNQEDKIIKTLQESSQRRVAIWAPDQDQVDLNPPEEVTIGAMLFSFDVERYEEL